MFEIFNKEEDKETEVTYPSGSGSQSSYSSPSNVFVVSVGGSVLLGQKPDAENVSEITSCLNDLIRQGYKLVLVIGGGKVCRDYVNAAKHLGANNFELDELGIKVSKVNASLLISAIENSFPDVLADIKQAEEVLAQGKTPVYGGIMPGFTTDAVAALLAEYLNATFINLSNVDGIFTADPAMHPSARMYRELSYDNLLEILYSNSMRPSQNLIIDLPAATILKRSSITAFFLNGHDMQNFRAAVQGSSFKGTIVRPDAEELFDDEEQVAPSPRRRTTRKKTTRRKPAKRKPAKKKNVSRASSEPLDPNEIRF